MANDRSIRCKRMFFLSLSAIIVAMVFGTAISGCKQSEKKKYVIGFINPNPGEKEGAQGFIRNMQKNGYVEGKNVTYIKCESKDMKMVDNALKDMLAKKVDLIFTMTTPATKKAVKITEGTNIPIVFILYDAVGSGVVKSLVNHGGNFTGIQLCGSTPKTLERLLTIAPAAKKILVPVSFDTGAAIQSLADLKLGVAKAGLELAISEVRTPEELSASMASMPENIDAIFMLHSFLPGAKLDIIKDAAKKRKIPIVSAGHVDYEDGLLMSYAPTDDRIGAQAARLAHGILHGTPPADLPVETSDFYLGINLKTAKSIGREIPYDILQQANFIVR